MGYWSYHPMGGDAPLDNVYKIEEFIVKSKGYDSLDSFSKKEFNIDNFYEIPFTIMAELYEEYKYILIDEAMNNYNFLAEEYKKYETNGFIIDKEKGIVTYDESKYKNLVYVSYKFILPFKFIEYGIRVHEEFIKDLIELVSDGGAKEREYEINDNSELRFDNPYDYARFVKKHANLLFNEKYKNEDVPDEIYKQLNCEGLLETILKEAEFEIASVNKN